MSEFFERSLQRLLGIEGDFSNHPADSGGATRFGVTEFLARRHGYLGKMEEYPWEAAKMVFRREFWDRMLLDEVALLSSEIAYELFECEVNTPYGTAPRFLQRALNVLNDREQIYKDVKVDGMIGPQTIGALKQFLRVRGTRGELVMTRGLNSLQGAYLIGLAEARQKDEAFMFGWLLHRVHI